MLEQEQLIGDAAGLALLDERRLQRERLGVGDEAEAPDLESSIAASVRAMPPSKCSSRSFMSARNRPASAPSISRWS